MNGYNIFYMGMSGNVVLYLEYHVMFLENCVIHCALNMDIRVVKEFAWKSLWHLHWWYLVMACVTECFKIDFSLGETMVVTLLGNVMSLDIIKLDDLAFPNVLQKILCSDRYWPHLKVLNYFGILI